MATSAQTLSQILDEMLRAKPADRAAAIELLSSKGLLPKKLTEVVKVKKGEKQLYKNHLMIVMMILFVMLMRL